MTSSTSNLLMMGLKGSGKTTYLAALWHYLESGEVDDRMRVPQLQPDRNYLNAIRSSWLSLKPVGRTSLRTGGMATMAIEDKQTGLTTEISLPDLSGELYKNQWSTRKTSRSYVEFARECKGVFLFVHASDVRRTHAIKPEELEGAADADTDGEIHLPISAKWTPTQSSTQVQLVDLLQLLMGLRDTPAGMRVATLISAWDLIKAPIPPGAWLDRKMPLLSQFLKANQDWLVSEVFGISSQGGDLDRDREQLLRSANPSARCRAVRGNQLDPVSITAPLQFLMEPA